MPASGYKIVNGQQMPIKRGQKGYSKIHRAYSLKKHDGSGEPACSPSRRGSKIQNRTEKKVNPNKIDQLAEALIGNIVEHRGDFSVKDTESFNDILSKNVFNSGFKKVSKQAQNGTSAVFHVRTSKKGKRSNQ